MLTPAEAVKTFFMPPGYRVELVASEPLIQDPIVIDWDPQGRLWAVEMPGFVPDLRDTGTQPRSDRPRRRARGYQPRRRDGQADGLCRRARPGAIAQGARSRRARCRAAQRVARCATRTATCEMDTKELVTRHVRPARRPSRAERQRVLLGARQPDAQRPMSDTYLRFKDGKFEVLPTLARGEWGVTQDDAGRIYRNTNESALHVDLVPTPYFARNPDSCARAAVTKRCGRRQRRQRRLAGSAESRERIARISSASIAPDGTLRPVHGGLRAGRLSRRSAAAELYGNVFVAEPAANLVGRIVLDDDGTSLARAQGVRTRRVPGVHRRAVPSGVSVECARRHVVYRRYVSRRDSAARATSPSTCAIYIVTRKLETADRARAASIASCTTRRRRDTAPASQPQICRRRSSSSGCRTRMAGGAIRRSGCSSSAATVRGSRSSCSSPRRPRTGTRLHALWTLDGLDAIAAGGRVDKRWTIRRATSVRRPSASPSDGSGKPGHAIQAAVLKRLEDERLVRAAPARGHRSASFLSRSARLRIASLLERYGDDPVTLDAALSGLRGAEIGVLERILESPGGRDAAT